MDTEFVIEGLTLPDRSAAQFTEEWASVGKATAYETWDGATFVVSPMYKRKWEITISAGGDAVWRLPPIGRIEPGDDIVYYACRRDSDIIPIGSDQVVMLREFVPGTVHVYDPSTEEDVEFVEGDDGRTISIADATDRVLQVSCRSKYHTKAVAVGEGNFDQTTGKLTWKLVIREASAPV